MTMGTDFQGTSADTWVSITTVDVAPSNQVNWLATVGNTFYLTGLQIEEGDKATDFEHLTLLQKNFALCQRYYAQTYGYGVTTKSFDQSYEGMDLFYWNWKLWNVCSKWCLSSGDESISHSNNIWSWWNCK